MKPNTNPQYIAVVDYGGSNIRSVVSAVRRVAGQAIVEVADTPEPLRRATAILMPGQGSFAQCMHGINAIHGMRDALEARVLGEGVPILGICVGFQIMADHGYEDGCSPGLGWMAGVTLPFGPTAGDNPVPQTGWNRVHMTHPAWQNCSGYYYFNHSYIVHLADPDAMWGTTPYQFPFVSAGGKKNIIGVQFHPEKSGAQGELLLRNFLLGANISSSNE